MIRNFIWEGNESGGGRDWFSLPFLFGYMEEVGGKECLRWNVRASLMKV